MPLYDISKDEDVKLLPKRIRLSSGTELDEIAAQAEFEVIERFTDQTGTVRLIGWNDDLTQIPSALSMALRLTIADRMVWIADERQRERGLTTEMVGGRMNVYSGTASAPSMWRLARFDNRPVMYYR